MAQPQPTHPCIVVPGIQGTGLENAYALPPATTWSALAGAEQKIGDVDLGSLFMADNALVDGTLTVVNRASQLLGIAYGSFVQALRGRSNFPVYVFPYDWRYSNAQNTKRLAHLVWLLQQKKSNTSLPDWDGTFDFVCHSMGGLIFRQFLNAWQSIIPVAALPVSRVVFIATPHLGSLDAVESLIRGETALFGGMKELRKMARTFPSVYELLPQPALNNAVVNQDGAPVDIFQVENWQQTVTPDPDDAADINVEQARLDQASQFLGALPSATDPSFNLGGRILVIYGNKANSTLRTVKVLPEYNGVANWYDFDNAVLADGDDVVPVGSATLAGVPAFEVQGRDISVFNLKSHVLSLHALLPSLDEVSSVASRWFSGVTGTDLVPTGTDPRRFHP